MIWYEFIKQYSRHNTTSRILHEYTGPTYNNNKNIRNNLKDSIPDECFINLTVSSTDLKKNVCFFYCVKSNYINLTNKANESYAECIHTQSFYRQNAHTHKHTHVEIYRPTAIIIWSDDRITYFYFRFFLPHYFAIMHAFLLFFVSLCILGLNITSLKKRKIK